MPAVTIRWKIPADVASSTASHDIRIYRSTSGEDGDYSLLATVSAGGGNTVKTYTDPGGDAGYSYFARYVPAGGSEGPRVLAVQEPGVREQRLAEQINGQVPEILKARLDSDLIDVRKVMTNALAALNAYSPQTSYTFTNLPGRFETGLVVLTLALLYVEKYLQVAIRDYNYGGTGITLNVDRGVRINQAVINLFSAVNKLLEFTKLPDWPSSPLGLGTEAIATPSLRVLQFLYKPSVGE